MTDSRPRARRAVVARSERPLGVAVLTGFVWIISLAMALGGFFTIVDVSINAADPDEPFPPSASEVFTFSAIGAGLIVGALLIAWLGAANAFGRPWAWTAISAGTIVLSCLLAVVVLGLALTAILSPRDNLAWAFAALAFAAVAAALWLIPRYYRQDAVRDFFGKPRRPTAGPT